MAQWRRGVQPDHHCRGQLGDHPGAEAHRRHRCLDRILGNLATVRVYDPRSALVAVLGWLRCTAVDPANSTLTSGAATELRGCWSVLGGLMLRVVNPCA